MSKWGITSDIEPWLIIIEAHSVGNAIEKYLKDWFPGSDEIHTTPVTGGEW